MIAIFRNYAVFLHTAITCLSFGLPVAAQAAQAQLTTLHSFGYDTGAYAEPSALAVGSDGSLYGANGNSLYKLSTSGVYTVLSDTVGGGPSRLIEGADGNFYGTTVSGGAASAGSVFELTQAGVATTLFSFSLRGSDFVEPQGVIQGSDGNFYGLTYQGGSSGNGSFYKVTPQGVQTVLYEFSKGIDGAGPDGSLPVGLLTQGSDGNFYGITTVGGAYSHGTIFKVTPTGTLTTLDSFTDSPVQTPYSGRMALGSDGLIYGTTVGSGAFGGGSIFTITSTGPMKTLFSLRNTDGEGIGPNGGLILGSDGNFYGTTVGGGSHGEGTIFRITPAGDYTTVYSFGSNSSGNGPAGALVEGKNGDFYGTTPSVSQGSYDLMTVFQLSGGLAPLKSRALGLELDFFGEGKSSYTVWRPATGYWYSNDGSGKTLGIEWGAPTDLPLVGDFDGDGKSDLAVFRPSTGYWYIIQSGNNETIAKQWGAASDVPIAGDFDGDGKTDIAVYRPSTGFWYIIQSSNNDTIAKQWGAASDVPVVGDFDGDGESDLAVFRPSTGYWYIIQSSNGLVVARQWGAATDIPVSGDFDGDGRTDIAVYRPSTGFWYIIQSSNNQTIAKQWGQSGDVPVARDYDGDGKTDIAVWRPSTGYWYVIESSTGGTTAVQWGTPTDVPVNHLSR